MHHASWDEKQSCLRMKISSVLIKCGPVFRENLNGYFPHLLNPTLASIYRLRTILVSRALSDTTLNEKTTIVASKNTGITLHRSWKLHPRNIEERVAAHGQFTCPGLGYRMCTDDSQVLRSHPPGLHIQQQMPSQMNGWRQRMLTEEHILFAKELSRLL